MGFGAVLHIVAMLVALLAMFVLGSKVDKLERQAIERGYAIYCPNDGMWAWVGECGE